VSSRGGQKALLCSRTSWSQRRDTWDGHTKQHSKLFSTLLAFICHQPTVQETSTDRLPKLWRWAVFAFLCIGVWCHWCGFAAWSNFLISETRHWSWTHQTAFTTVLHITSFHLPSTNCTGNIYRPPLKIMKMCCFCFSFALVCDATGVCLLPGPEWWEWWVTKGVSRSYPGVLSRNVSYILLLLEPSPFAILPSAKHCVLQVGPKSIYVPFAAVTHSSEMSELFFLLAEAKK
jgi:hypothetical protein